MGDNRSPLQRAARHEISLTKSTQFQILSASKKAPLTAKTLLKHHEWWFRDIIQIDRIRDFPIIPRTVNI
jgi:hypothetical protein